MAQTAEQTTTWRVTTTVLPGHRIEVTATDLAVGEQVEVIVLRADRALPRLKSTVEFLDSLPEGPRSASTWEELERNLQAERDSWDR